MSATPAAALPLDPWPPGVVTPEGVDGVLDHLSCTGITAVLWQCSARWRIEPRLIPDEMLFHVRRGRGLLRLPGRVVPLGPGTCAHIRRSERHSATTVPSDPLEVVAIHYQATVGGVTLADLVDLPDAFPLPLGGREDHTIELACREYARREAGWQPRLRALVQDLLIGLVRAGAGSWLQAPPHLAQARRLMPAIHAMRSQLASPLTIAALARRCDLSVAQFRRIFQHVFSCSPLAYCHRLRMAEAARLLRDEGVSVTAAAARVGYADPAWFSRTFQRATGQRPGAFARSAGL